VVLDRAWIIAVDADTWALGSALASALGSALGGALA
jgi:hypothetical protein